jgi:hypothetical protein
LQIRTYVVWIPMLDADEASEVPSVATNIAITPQYFDGEKRLGHQLAKAMDVDQPIWDSFFFYAPGATWTETGLPLPEVGIAQDNGVVIGTPGSLPPLPDQSRLGPGLKGKAIVIGEQENFEAILEQIARAFAARHRR